MAADQRQHHRVAIDYQVVLGWKDAGGRAQSVRARARDASATGIRVETTVAIAPATKVSLDIPRHGSPIEATVRYCVPEAAIFRVGLQFSAGSHQQAEAVGAEINYYEVLQLSSNAEPETIHRVYRIMAARFHPDNPDGGDRERFLLLTEAYRVLSDPEKRARYDLLRRSEPRRPMALFQTKAFIDDKQGEINRRLGVLCLLYAQRRRDPDRPTITLMDLEEVMSIPREYLQFTLWYLRQKQYVEMNSGADFSLTAAGVDFIEEHTPAQDILHRLLAGGGTSGLYDPAASAQFGASRVQ